MSTKTWLPLAEAQRGLRGSDNEDAGALTVLHDKVARSSGMAAMLTYKNFQTDVLITLQASGFMLE